MNDDPGRRHQLISIVILRTALSKKYKKFPDKPGDWHNNDANNSLDSFIVYDDDKIVFSCRCQTVANMEGLDPSCSYSHTIAQGPFYLKAFVAPRLKYGRIHGIIRTKNYAGEVIDEQSVTPSCKLRNLVHDWQSNKPKPPHTDTRVAWSDGCFILSDKDLEQLGAVFDKLGVTVGDKIQGVLVEE